MLTSAWPPTLRLFSQWSHPASPWLGMDSWKHFTHCKNAIPKILNKYSQKRNCVASVPVPIFMFLCAIYIFPRSVCLFFCRKIGGPIAEILYINRLQTHECGNWDLGRAIPFLGIHKTKFLCSAPLLNASLF